MAMHYERTPRQDNSAMRGQLPDDHVRDYVLAGDATITVHSPSSVHFTYRIKVSDDGQRHFVSVLTGQDNAADFEYLGFIRDSHAYVHGRKSRISDDAPSAKGFAWLWERVNHGVTLAPARVFHEGRCGRCGRKLTVPESVATGYGPECSDKLGIERASLPARADQALVTAREPAPVVAGEPLPRCVGCGCAGVLDKDGVCTGCLQVSAEEEARQNEAHDAEQRDLPAAAEPAADEYGDKAFALFEKLGVKLTGSLGGGR